MIRKGHFMSRRRRQQGQGFVEFGLFVALFVVVTLGIVTFGHAFLVVNMITHAARDGARLAATWTPRAACHGLDDSNTGGGSTGAIQTVVKNKITTVTAAPMTVQIAQIPSQVGRTEGNCATPTGSDPPTVRVTVTGCVPYVFQIISSGCFNVGRVAEFADEGLGTGGGG
jgi:Flp pilus assembly protein TadG